MKIRRGNRAAAWLLVSMLLLALAAAGCGYKRLSVPDAEFNKQVYSFNAKVMAFMVGLEQTLADCRASNLQKDCLQADYAKHKVFYMKEAPLGLALLRLRAGANPPNSKTTAWIDQVASLLEEFRRQDQQNKLTYKYVLRKRQIINQAFVQILLREKAKEIAHKKRGKK